MPALSGWCRAANAVMPAAPCRPVKTTGVGSHWIKLAVTGGTSASPARGEPEPVPPCMHVDQKSIGKVARITMAATRNVIAAPSKVH
jgi:hypothetical protein